MTVREPVLIQSRENPLLKQLKRLAHESGAYRKQGRVWIEGEHLCSAARLRGWQPELVVVTESAWQAASHQPAHGQRSMGSLQPEFHKQKQSQTPAHKALSASKKVVMTDALWREFTALESPSSMGWVLALPEAPDVLPDAPTVVLDCVQDAGNVGSILRSAAAFGFAQVLALKGTALLWSPKVLRAGMGAHFGLRLVEGLTLDDLQALQVPLLATSSHQGQWLHRAPLPWPCGWLMGHEGQGVSPALQARAAQHIRIVQPGGEESLNVAAAAAVCLHASAAQQSVA